MSFVVLFWRVEKTWMVQSSRNLFGSDFEQLRFTRVEYVRCGDSGGGVVLRPERGQVDEYHLLCQSQVLCFSLFAMVPVP